MLHRRGRCRHRYHGRRPKLIPVEMDQEEVAVFRQYGLVEAPVVDDAGRLVGVITVDDIVEVIEEEAEEDAPRGVRKTICTAMSCGWCVAGSLGWW